LTPAAYPPFTRAQTGLLQGRLGYDVNNVETLVTETFSAAVTDVLSLAFTLATMLMLDKGRLVDRGNHPELLSRGGLYAELHATQFQLT
jgi:ABC-type transport system involved in cytochrome bd biosynthesis fused ATPase/permease subunit